MKWRPIETVEVKPFSADIWYMRASETVLLWTRNWVEIGFFRYTQKGKGRWECAARGRILHPTHWMPLPDAPNKDNTE